MALVGVVLVVAQAAAGEAAFRGPAEAGRPPRRECVAVQVSSPQQPRQRRPVASFSATRVLDIEFQALLRRRLDGPRTLELKLYTPRGHLYQVLTVPFTGSARDAVPSGQRFVDGHPQPLREQVAKPVRFGGLRRYSVGGSLPVAGTTIMVNSLYGQWRVEPHLDGDTAPCGPARSFAITQ